MDVVVAAGAEGAVMWHANMDGAGSFSTVPTVVTTAAEDVRSVVLSDLDRDGDLDILSASWQDHRVAWYPNVGSGVFPAQVVVSDTSIGAQWVHAADLDGDGDEDVLAVSEADDTVRWFVNEACASSCPEGEYAVSGCVRHGDSVSDACRVCDVAARCDAGTEYLSGCGGVSAGECVSCSSAASCPEGWYESAACSATADRECSPCCGDGEWGSGCGGTSAGVCKSCGVEAVERCTASEFLVGCRGGTTGGVCTACSASGCPADSFPVATCGSRSNSDWQCQPVSEMWEQPVFVAQQLEAPVVHEARCRYTRAG